MLDYAITWFLGWLSGFLSRALCLHMSNFSPWYCQAWSQWLSFDRSWYSLLNELIFRHLSLYLSPLSVIVFSRGSWCHWMEHCVRLISGPFLGGGAVQQCLRIADTLCYNDTYACNCCVFILQPRLRLEASASLSRLSWHRQEREARGQSRVF